MVFWVCEIVLNRFSEEETAEGEEGAVGGLKEKEKGGRGSEVNSDPQWDEGVGCEGLAE